MVAAWFLFTYFWPRMLLSVFKRAILVKGFGDGPIPVNTLYTEPQTLFADPLHAPRLGLKIGDYWCEPRHAHDGWLARSLQRTASLACAGYGGRYYSVQFTDPSKNTNFAYVGKRTTGTQAGDYLITVPGWKGQVPGGMTQISSPNNSVLVFGRMLVESDSDLSTAYDLSKQIQLTPLSEWQPGQ